MPGSKKFFRIATEGATSDGRNIDRNMLQQMARSYDPKTYGARINLEHIRGIDPKGLFQAYGDVVALKAEEQAGKMRLFAQLDPTTELVSLTQARQKIFCSMEVTPDFADTGEAYLTGLAVTDNPASLGCEMLQFSAKAKVNPLADRKQHPGNLFSEAVEIDLDFSDDAPQDPAPPTNGLAASIKRLFGKVERNETGRQAQQADTHEAVSTLAQEIHAMGGQFSKVTAALESIATHIDTIQTEQQKDKAEFASLKTALESTETYSRRPPATGGDGSAAPETDC